MQRIIALDDRTRRRAEDPHTGAIAEWFHVSVVVHRSRFEVDLNRARGNAVSLTPEDAWGLDLWEYSPDEEVVHESVQLC